MSRRSGGEGVVAGGGRQEGVPQFAVALWIIALQGGAEGGRIEAGRSVVSGRAGHSGGGGAWIPRPEMKTTNFRKH